MFKQIFSDIGELTDALQEARLRWEAEIDAYGADTEAIAQGGSGPGSPQRFLQILGDIVEERNLQGKAAMLKGMAAQFIGEIKNKQKAWGKKKKKK